MLCIQFMLCMPFMLSTEFQNQTVETVETAMEENAACGTEKNKWTSGENKNLSCSVWLL